MINNITNTTVILLNILQIK